MKKKKVVFHPEFKKQAEKLFPNQKKRAAFIKAIRGIDFSKGTPIGNKGLHFIDVGRPPEKETISKRQYRDLLKSIESDMKMLSIIEERLNRYVDIVSEYEKVHCKFRKPLKAEMLAFRKDQEKK